VAGPDCTCIYVARAHSGVRVQSLSGFVLGKTSDKMEKNLSYSGQELALNVTPRVCVWPILNMI